MDRNEREIEEYHSEELQRFLAPFAAIAERYRAEEEEPVRW